MTDARCVVVGSKQLKERSARSISAEHRSSSAAHHYDITVGDKLLFTRSYDFHFDDVLLRIKLFELELLLVVVPGSCNTHTK